MAHVGEKGVLGLVGKSGDLERPGQFNGALLNQRFQMLPLICQFLLDIPARRNVANHAGEESALGNLPLGQRKFQWKLAAILAHTEQFHGLAHHAGLAASAHPLHAVDMRLTKTRRHKKRQRLTNDFAFQIAENALGATVPFDDLSRTIAGDDGVVG